MRTGKQSAVKPSIETRTSVREIRRRVAGVVLHEIVERELLHAVVQAGVVVLGLVAAVRRDGLGASQQPHVGAHVQLLVDLDRVRVVLARHAQVVQAAER